MDSEKNLTCRHRRVALIGPRNLRTLLALRPHRDNQRGATQLRPLLLGLGIHRLGPNGGAAASIRALQNITELPLRGPSDHREPERPERAVVRRASTGFQHDAEIGVRRSGFAKPAVCTAAPDGFECVHRASRSRR